MKTSTKKHRVRDSYFELIHTFPLRPIRSEAVFDRAIAVLLRLSKSKPEQEWDAGERDYVEALAMLVQRFEQESRRASLPKRSAIDRLKFLMQEQAMTIAELAKIIGSQPNASLILRGKRSMSKAHILKLAGHFEVSPALFLS